ncbi:MAG: methyltransferase domain-containing protein [Pseudomonadota bacterium]
MALARLMTEAHHGAVFQRRVRVLADVLSSVLAEVTEGAPTGRLLDIGCGDGSVAREVQARAPRLACEGVDVLLRAETVIPVQHYDGLTLPYPDGAFDWAMLIDVLHHADQPEAVLQEARRVARRGVLIKDHFRDGFAAESTLRLMDWVGNRGHGVALPYTYWSEREWAAIFARLNMTILAERRDFRLYPAPFSSLFDRGLHFVALLA